ncbi:MAG: ComEA family DNA-binding protein, partial [Anaerolineales bacterium]
MNEERISINPNTAEKEDLEKLPGVGPELSQRIIERRPYS